MNYKEKFTKAAYTVISDHIEDKSARMTIIGSLVNLYVQENGTQPPADILDLLADEIMYEEIHDPHPDKMTRNDYPIMSSRQERTRAEKRADYRDADEYDATGVNRAKPYRRKRNMYEINFVDHASYRKNRARNAQYKRDTSAGPLLSYNLRETGGELTEPFVQSAYCSAQWERFISREEEVTDIIAS